ncbi:MAG: UDP-N-acetylmuramate--L-alanine ligase [Acidobacteria bacterium]|nr:UDP-N-acetylmuramate--L-alanine ligase [Acidobacteriota bacterium]
MLGKIRRIHFVGIGGIGMSGIAEVLLNLGFSVSGSDLKQTPVTERLARLGAQVFEGHAATNVGDAEVVVVSSAVPPQNPEIAEAIRHKIPVIPRAEMLAELMRLKFCVAVAGSHGKTTVTSMVAVMLAEAGLDPTAVIGGRLDAFGSSARLGKGELMVVEADESDRSFLYLLPTLAVITNIDREHLDHYENLEEIENSFASFMNKVPFYGVVIACTDAPWRRPLETLLPRLRRRVVTYGIEPGADVTARNLDLQSGSSLFDVDVNGNCIGRFTVNIAGRHNVQNALAAIAVGRELDLTPEQIREGLEHFRGADRRFQIKAELDGITVVDDYGHHPTEIQATLEAAKLHGAKRIWAIFQPHRYTRTKFLMDDFARCFGACDRVYVLDIYPASEPPIAGVTSERLVRRMSELGFKRARYRPSPAAVLEEVLAEANAGDLILTVGAGSVWTIAEALAAGLSDRMARVGGAKG